MVAEPPREPDARTPPHRAGSRTGLRWPAGRSRSAKHVGWQRSVALDRKPRRSRPLDAGPLHGSRPGQAENARPSPRGTAARCRARCARSLVEQAGSSPARARTRTPDQVSCARTTEACPRRTFRRGPCCRDAMPSPLQRVSGVVGWSTSCAGCSRRRPVHAVPGHEVDGFVEANDGCLDAMNPLLPITRVEPLAAFLVQVNRSPQELTAPNCLRSGSRPRLRSILSGGRPCTTGYVSGSARNRLPATSKRKHAWSASEPGHGV